MPYASFVSLNNPSFTCESICGAASSPGGLAPPGLAKVFVSLLPWKRGRDPRGEERGHPLFLQSSTLLQHLPCECRKDPTPSPRVSALGTQGAMLKLAASQMMSRCVVVYPVHPFSLLFNYYALLVSKVAFLSPSLNQNRVLYAFIPIFCPIFSLVAMLKHITEHSLSPF